MKEIDSELQSRLHTHEPSSNSELVMKNVNKGRDYSIYKWRMDAAVNAKVEKLLSVFKDIRDGMVIVDAGSGTGLVAQKIAEHCHRLGVHPRVIALDLSHEYYDVSSDHPLIELAFGDAALQLFPGNSIHIKYFSTSGHEIESYGIGMQQAVENTFRELVPGGQIIIRDFVKPQGTEPLLMELPMDDGIDVDENRPIDQIDYSALSTWACFKRFYLEFNGGAAFEYELVEINGKKLIKVLPEWAYEFYVRNHYRTNWRNEIHEKYSYWTPTDAAEVLKAAGYEHVIVELEENEYILNTWLKGQIGLFRLNSQNELDKVAFPPTHMVVTATKPVEASEQIEPLDDRLLKVIDFDQLYETIDVDLDQCVINFSSRITDENSHQHDKTISFRITDDPPYHGRKFSVYRLRDYKDRIIKIPRIDQELSTDYGQQVSQFKALLQIAERQHILEEFETPHLNIYEVDPEGPPYRYVIQDALPSDAVCVADLILDGKLSESDIRSICDEVNKYEGGKKYQLDTNPFAWFRVTNDEGDVRLIYASGKVYAYHEDWEFRKVGLLQWTDPKYLENAEYFFAQLPKRKEQQQFASEWEATDKFEIWKRYLQIARQPMYSKN